MSLTRIELLHKLKCKLHPSKLESTLQVGVREHFNLVSYVILAGESESGVENFKKGAKFQYHCDILVISL